jgi:hypothetical protein
MFTIDALLDERAVTPEHELAVAARLYRRGLATGEQLDAAAAACAAAMMGRLRKQGSRRRVNRTMAIAHARPADPFGPFPRLA